MSYGVCDVPKCEEVTFLGWRPLTEKIGRQICEYHFSRHKDKTDRFNLYDAFGFKRPLIKTKPVKLKDYCACGRELQPGRKYCTTCIAERKRRQRKESYHRKKLAGKNIKQPQRNILICRTADCENEREPNHRYCQKCAKTRRYRSRGKINRKYYFSHRA